MAKIEFSSVGVAENSISISILTKIEFNLGRVLPPKLAKIIVYPLAGKFNFSISVSAPFGRPRDQKGKMLDHLDLKMAEREGEDLNLTDYENWLLSRFDSRDGVPQGLERLTNEKWVAHVKSDLPKSEWTFKHL